MDTKRPGAGAAGPAQSPQQAGSLSTLLALKGYQELPKGSQSAPLGSFLRRIVAAPEANWNWLAVAVNLPFPSPPFGIGLLRHDVVLVCHPLRFCDSSIAGASRWKQAKPPGSRDL
jgi:hypothetical protein